MSGALTTVVIQKGIEQLATTIESCADDLNELDGIIGDGDLGVTMIRGVRELVNRSPHLPDDVGGSLLKCAQALTKVSGSTYGTILATGLMGAAKISKGRSAVPWNEMSTLLSEAIDAMAKRGQSKLGDKTVLDAIESVRKAIDGLDNPEEIAFVADNAVAESLDIFREKSAKQGRARIFGDKSIGIDDPGMVAFKKITESFCKGLKPDRDVAENIE